MPEKIRRIFRIFLCAVMVFLPFGFGGLVTGTEASCFPSDFLVWVILGFTPACPGYVAGIFGVLACIGAIAIYPSPKGRFKDGVLTVLPWLLIVISCAVGFIRTTELEVASVTISHFAGVALFGYAVWHASQFDAKLVPCLGRTCAVVAGVLCIHGIYQRLWGIEAELKKMRAEYLAQYGAALPTMMDEKMQQLRIHSFFSDPNTFAAHLVATASLVFCALWDALKKSTKTQKRYWLIIVGVILALTLYWTGSRGAIIGVLGACGVWFWRLPVVNNWRWKWLLPVALVGMVAAVLLVARMNAARGGLSTAHVRVNYYAAGFRMFRESPLCGVGLGEYFTHFVRDKLAETELTRDPHSFFMSQLSQCGILGGLFVLVALFLPVCRLWRSSLEDVRSRIVLCALVGWGIHSFFQFNELVAPTMYIVCWLPLMARPQTQMAECSPRRIWHWGILAIPVLLGVFLMSRIVGERQLSIVSDRAVDVQKLHQLMRKSGMESSAVQAYIHAQESLQKAYLATASGLSTSAAAYRSAEDIALQMIVDLGLQYRESIVSVLEIAAESAAKRMQLMPHRVGPVASWVHLSLLVQAFHSTDPAHETIAEKERYRKVLEEALAWGASDAALRQWLGVVNSGNLAGVLLSQNIKLKLYNDGKLTVEKAPSDEARAAFLAAFKNADFGKLPDGINIYLGE